MAWNPEWEKENEAVRKSIREADYDAIRKAIRARVKAAVPGQCIVIYDAFPNGPDGLPIDNLDEVAVEGKVIFFDDDTEVLFESPVIENPTWLTVCKIANEMLIVTKDQHHVFLEGLDEKKSAKRADGVKVFWFNMGS